MMNRGVVKVLSIVVAVCVLSVGGLAIGQSMAHDFDHQSHHQPVSHHSTVLCSWLCIAGQGWEVTVTQPLWEGFPSEWIEHWVSERPSIVHSYYIAARGPPVF
ncbi:MAG: hypothetical protein NHB36_06450 [Nitrospira sp.]|nr:hypothetical protein [Nitrospira sp.]